MKENHTQPVKCLLTGEWQLALPCIPGRCEQVAPEASANAYRETIFMFPSPYDSLDVFRSKVVYICPEDHRPQIVKDAATFEFGATSIESYGHIYNFTMYCDITWFASTIT